MYFFWKKFSHAEDCAESLEDEDLIATLLQLKYHLFGLQIFFVDKEQEILNG